MSLLSCWRYFVGVWRHKWFVLLACHQLGVSLPQALLHDLQKFFPVEFFPYVRQFYNRDGSKRQVRDATDPNAQSLDFQRAWLHHQRLPHHWQAWISIGGNGVLSALPIPEKYAREMVADWAGAGRSYSNETDPRAWYMANRDKMVLHPDTRVLIDTLMTVHFGDLDVA